MRILDYRMQEKLPLPKTHEMSPNYSTTELLIDNNPKEPA